MGCPSCQQENRPEARFCAACGAPLELACPACGAAFRAGARFCDACGKPLAAEVAPPSEVESGDADAGERRQLTLLFCDLVGSSEIAARLDPEDWRAATRAYQGAAGAVVARFGGHVAQHLGDGLLVYFGWPEAHDNDAERSVLAGLAIVEEVGRLEVLPSQQRFSVRIGIHTGPVVVGDVGAAGHSETLALGDTPNVAARIQALAEPGVVLISAATQRLVAGLFVAEERGAQALRGISLPVALYQIAGPSGVRGRLAAAAQRGLTPFVGREDERSLLRRRFEQAQQGEGQVVVISGEPGIGKSRLVQQLHEGLAGETYTWIECAGSPFFQHTPFHAVTEMLQQAFGRLPDATPEERLAALEAALALAGQKPAEGVPLVAPLLGIPLPERYPPPIASPEQQRRQLLSTLVGWVLGFARAQPVVIVLDDLHWADASTLELTQLLVEQGASARLLLLYTARPELRAPWPLRSHHTWITLARLGRQHVQQMARRVAAHAALPPELLEAVIARTDGVPLFVEELTKWIVEGAASSAREIPATLADSLMARLDRLGSAKEVAQIASVLGREFSYALLRAVCALPDAALQDALAKLADAELLFARGLPPDASYLFKHALVQDAAYGSLLKTRRRELHRAAARALGERLPELAAAHPELLAHHHSEAGDPEAALAAWQQAGERALLRSAHAEAAEHLARGIAALEALPPSRERSRRELPLRAALGQALIVSKGYASPETAREFTRARELAAELGDAQQLHSVLFGVCAAAIAAARMREADALADEMLRAAEAAQDVQARVWAHQLKGFTALPLGDLARADAELARCVELYRTLPGPWVPYDPGVPALAWRAQVLAMQGRLDEARRLADEGLALGLRSQSPFDQVWGHSAPMIVHSMLRDGERWLVHAEAQLALGTEHGFELFAAAGLTQRGSALLELGELGAGVAALRDGLDRTRATGVRTGMSSSLSRLATYTPDLDEARALLEEALAVTVEQPVFLCPVLRAKARLLARSGAAQQPVEAAWRAAVEDAHCIGARLSELEAAVEFARWLRDQGRAAEARALLAPVYACFTQGFDTRPHVEARALLAELGA